MTSREERELWRKSSAADGYYATEIARLVAEVDRLTAKHPHVIDCKVMPRQMTEEELSAVTTDGARLTKERDEARAGLAELSLLRDSNLAMQADRDELHKRIEVLKDDRDLWRARAEWLLSELKGGE
jgi:hypothetical protein